MFDLDETIRERRSVRGFLPGRLVPRQVICEALELAQRARQRREPIETNVTFVDA
jgi:nitroreductase